MEKNILQSNVNGFLALIFVGTFTFAAWFVLWQAAFDQNPIANAMAAQLQSQGY